MLLISLKNNFHKRSFKNKEIKLGISLDELSDYYFSHIA